MLIDSTTLLCVLLALLLCFAALHDIATRTVPNWVSVGILSCAIMLHAFAGGLIGGLLVGLLVLIITFFFWRRGWLGGADVKLLAATSAAMPFAMFGVLLIATAFAGGLVAVVYLVLGLLVKRPSPGARATLLRRVLKAEAWRIHHHAPLPYATAIAIGALFTLITG
jgi:prepilin peptidase CpaA